MGICHVRLRSLRRLGTSALADFKLNAASPLTATKLSSEIMLARLDYDIGASVREPLRAHLIDGEIEFLQLLFVDIGRQTDRRQPHRLPRRVARDRDRGPQIAPKIAVIGDLAPRAAHDIGQFEQARASLGGKDRERDQAEIEQRRAFGRHQRLRHFGQFEHRARRALVTPI